MEKSSVAKKLCFSVLCPDYGGSQPIANDYSFLCRSFR